MIKNNWNKVKNENNILELDHNSEFYRAYIYSDNTIELIVRDEIDNQGKAKIEQEFNIPDIDEMINTLVELKEKIKEEKS